jgi:hypothetical protein
VNATIFKVPTPTELLGRYRKAAEALHDALLAFGTRFHTEDHGEYARLLKLVETCQDELDEGRREFERGVPEGLQRSGEKGSFSPNE